MKVVEEYSNFCIYSTIIWLGIIIWQFLVYECKFNLKDLNVKIDQSD
jgi:hypothetical protein